MIAAFLGSSILLFETQVINLPHSLSLSVFSNVWPVHLRRLPPPLLYSLLHRPYKHLQFYFADGDQRIKRLGNTFVTTSDALELTSNVTAGSSSGIGWAIYYKPITLYDSATGLAVNFQSIFSFEIIPPAKDTCTGDGLAFFIAHANWTENKLLGGEGLGIFNTTLGAVNSQIIAIEFDTFKNSFDPSANHMGIDVNSAVSNVTEDWTSDNSRSLNGTAFVGYNSTTGTLSSLLSYRNDTLPLSTTLDINLTTVLPETVVIGFSAATGTCLEAHRIRAWSFSAAVPAPATTATSPSPTPDTAPKLLQNKAVKLHKMVVILMACLIPLFIVVVVIILIVLRMRKKETDGPADGGMNVDTGPREFTYTEQDGPADGRMNVDAGPREFTDLAAATNGFSADGRMNVDTGPREFTYTELAAATNEFSDELGHGGFGAVYKGTLRDTNTVVAVKRFSKRSSQGKKEFEAEVTVISRLRHRNLVKLIGWCHDRDEFLLVYEYMEGGSLYSHLFSSEGRPVLSWHRRRRVVLDLASAVQYLHEECEQYIVHRDIKLTNVMVDAEFNARLGDFGLARLVDHGLSPRTTETVVGTKGYCAPEYVFKGKASRQSDVYSFGMVLLEIATGQKATELIGDKSLVEWIWELYGRRSLMEAADNRLNSRFDPRQMQRTMEVGLWCVHTDPRSRPTMRKAIGGLRFETEIPSLPRTKPPWDPQPSMCESIATFFTCSSNETGHPDVDPPWAASTSSFVGPATIDQQRQTADHSFREDAC